MCSLFSSNALTVMREKMLSLHTPLLMALYLLSQEVTSCWMPQVESLALQEISAPQIRLYLTSRSLTLAAFLFQRVSQLVFKCNPATSLVLGLIPVYSMSPFQRIPPVRPQFSMALFYRQPSQTPQVLPSALCYMQTQYMATHLLLIQPVEMLCCPLEAC